MFKQQQEVTVKMTGSFACNPKDNVIKEEDVVLSIMKAFANTESFEYRPQVIDVELGNLAEAANELTPFGMICNHLENLYNKKNHDYGNSFDKQLDEDGLLVSKIRLSDKLGRFSNLIKNEALVKDEKITDTMIDLACYSIMTLMWMQKKNIN